MSFYAIDPDQKFCRSGVCLDPVKPIPGLPQVTANPLHKKPDYVTSGHQVPANRPTDTLTISTSAPLKFGKEPKPANVLMAGAVMAVVLVATTRELRWQSLLIRVSLFMLIWHSVRLAFPHYY
jgi:hypothetical protein